MKILISNSGEVSKPFIERIHLIHGDVTQQDTDAIAILIPQDLQFSGSINLSVRAAAEMMLVLNVGCIGIHGMS